MKHITTYQNKKILVVGLAKSGVAASLLLHRLGAFVTVNDWKPLSENKEAQSLLDEGIKVVCGSHPVELLEEGFELIVKNPGIPYTNELIKGAREMGLPVITEVELAYLISESTMIGITGTNGKTTTTTLVHHMIEAAKQPVYMAGNIGTVACEVAQKAKASDTMVVELSSFQLMGINEFKPSIAVITNIYDAHLDYHSSRDEYVKAKTAVTKNQTEKDFLIVNADQPELMDRVSFTKAQIIPFSTKKIVSDGLYVSEGVLYFKGEEIIHTEEIVLPGAHNLENILAAVAAAKLSGADNQAIRSVLATFTGVRHRTQFVREWNDVKFYNDSKATNTLATKSALDAFQKPTILLCGGLDRGNSFDDLIPYLKNVKSMIAFGQTAQKMLDMGEKAGIKSLIKVHSVKESVGAASELASPGDIVLLSPACASWDQHPTFEVRGDIFIDEVNKL
ncbi:UDP-N-acetylmuramoyl-L-alanine--D-glutamate ligase [Jeotgalibacillus proteolyticus]|uniref:UDP-N-acetylmuramoylalanine--D-glutamate ligase n=1 Tax=Jeotgalibacillus proteolyticus TaxID=2082395 RepID=A0A2S5GGP6_9BACL|nr:UDP-N-acetylmuramoyl-L-alanine--D-glutamate ligase [Jeotgalibacillus proteolyticus]PPA72138.1 UDP-N-acetylmuramoyl-L-alanine--D-glutamate ligase [Jeotgalibacillus proteolyticus]